MSTDTFPPLDDEHIRSIGISLGLGHALRTLQKKATEEGFQRLPGYNTAIAVIESVEADFRAGVAGSNFRAAQKAGVDIVNNTIGMRGLGELFFEPLPPEFDEVEEAPE